MNARTLIISLATAALASLPCAARTKIACIGNSITYGFGIADREHQSYPAQLQRLLGEDYEVGNFGRNGATLLRHGHNPWSKTDEAKAAFAFRPDVAVIHLGINDTDPRNWPQYGREFATDYKWLLDTLRTINPGVRIIMANLSPIQSAHRRFRSGTCDWRDLIREQIAAIASHEGVELIDFSDPLNDHPDLIPDNLHPTTTGARLLADYVRGAITGNHGGLSLPSVYSSGMVLPHGRYFTVRGTADTGANVTLTIGEQTHRAVADNLGHWSVKVAPIPVGGPYEMTVTDGKSTLTLTDVMSGEVWLASGQSNMEFTLRESTDAPADPDSRQLMRVYRMSDRQRPGADRWDDSTIEAVDTLNYYKPAHWAAPDNDFSAVAWHFGAMLADSLRMPIGIISNPVGGAGIESFIDIETLRHGMPEMLIDWQHNDYVMPWSQKRVQENSGTGHRHPYEPSYLFSAGIKPLGSYPINGVIWYQGESNAHNIELHEQLFPMLLSSWRREFDNPSLPFIITQISSIERPSWPEFRDSQRRLADGLTDVYMAVSSDKGLPYNVHPPQKAPIGRRLARQALHHLYGFSHLTPGGPIPIRAEAWPDGSIRLIMTDADGLTTSDGKPLSSFEIAEYGGIYQTAEVEINHNSDTLILRHPDMKNPRYARYGWQPFSKGNMINSDSLPASTFSIEAVEVEPGLHHGVSASFGGTIGGMPVIAGGCNFPYPDPLADGLKKVYYRGIYRATDGMRIGSLPVATAYGASAATPLGLAMIGGEGLASAWLMTIDDNGNTEIIDLPSLPVTLDNAYAAADGTRVYVAGGNADGKPWNGLLTIDLADPAAGWTRLADMPGNPRVQPVMAAGPDGRLYLWGGFCPRFEGHEPTLQCDGLCYDPTTDSWTLLPTPAIGRNKISLGGGVAACIDGKIVCTGGVNRDVFINALRKQPDDYLQHPAEWYRFNGHVLTFDPETYRWTVGTRSPEYARAGAACAIIDNGHTLLLMGGELKPRIRTPRFTPVK